MKLPGGMFAVALLLAGMGTSQAAIRIANDRGGPLNRYLDGYEERLWPIGDDRRPLRVGLHYRTCGAPPRQNMRNLES